MKFKLKIEKYLSGNKTNIYSIRFINSDDTSHILNETEKFFDKIKNSNPEEYQTFIALLKNIVNISGAKEKFFRDESNADCNFLKALIRLDVIGKKYKGNIRLYCLYYGQNKVILGNGDFKSTRTFNEDDNLNKIARILQKLDKALDEKEKDKEVYWEENELINIENHIFEIET